MRMRGREGGRENCKDGEKYRREVGYGKMKECEMLI